MKLPTILTKSSVLDRRLFLSLIIFLLLFGGGRILYRLHSGQPVSDYADNMTIFVPIALLINQFAFGYAREGGLRVVMVVMAWAYTLFLVVYLFSR
jgi:hypothetical protein